MTEHPVDRTREVAWVAVALAFALVAVVARFDTSALPAVGRFRDDAYFYFVWAENFAAGHGPVISAGVPTSGVHIGWALVLTVNVWLFGADTIEISAQWTGLLLHLATAVVLALAIPTRAWLRVACACVYAGHPFVLTEAQNGQDTALAAFALAVLIATRERRAPVFVAASLLAVAARSDLMFFVVALALWRTREPLLRRVLWPTLVLGACVAWNFALAGHALQDSAVPIPWLIHDQFARTDPDVGDQLQRLWWFSRPVLLGGPFAVSLIGSAMLVAASVRRRWPWLRVVPVLLVAAAGVAGASDLAVPAFAAIAIATLPRASCRLRTLARPLLLGAFAFVAVHYVVRQFPRDYYFVPIVVAGTCVLGHAAHRMGHRVAMALVLAAVAVSAWDLRERPRGRHWQEPMVMAGRFLDRFVPSTEPVGCFNSGIVTWLRDGPVVNLDGIVNRSAFDALRSGRLSEYLDACGIDWLVDHPVQFASDPSWPHATGAYFGDGFDPTRDLREVARFVVRGGDAGRPGTDSFRLYSRSGRAASWPTRGSVEGLGPSPNGGYYIAWRPSRGDRLLVGAERQSTRLVAESDGVDTTWVLKLPAWPPVRHVVSVESSAGVSLPVWEYDAMGRRGGR